jgi:hypothetical protein
LLRSHNVTHPILGEHRQVRARVVLAVLPVLAVGAFALAALDEPLESVLVPGSWASRTLRLLALAAGGTALVWAYRAARVLSRYGRTEVSLTLPPPESTPGLGSYPSRDALVAIRARLAQRYPKEVIEQFGRWAVQPYDRLRLEETFTIELDKARTESKAEFLLPGSDRERLTAALQAGKAGVVVVPLLWLRKGTLLDDLVVTDSADIRLVALSRPETAAMMGWAVVPLISLLTTGATDTAFDHDAWEMTDRIRQVLSHPEPVDPDLMWDTVLDELATAGHTASDLEARSPDEFVRFRELCHWLADHYVLAVEAPLPTGNYLSIRYTHSLTIPSVGPTSLSGRLEAMLGLEPRQYLIPIRAAVWFGSYHAEIDGRVRNQYVRRQEIVAIDREDPEPIDETMFATDGDHAPDQRPRMTLRNDSGYIYPHFHITNLGYVRNRRSLGWRVQFEEIPPGGLAPVVALSAAVTLIAAVFAVAAARITQLDLDAPALALAVPLFVITVFGFSFAGLLRSTLVVAAGFVGASLLSIASVLSLLTLRDVQPSTDQWFVLDEPTVLGQPFHLLLGGCAVLGMLMTLYLVAVLVVRLERYRLHQQSVHTGS